MAPGSSTTTPVFLVDVELLDTGESWTGVRLEHPDLTEYELAAHRNHWPDVQHGASLWGSFVAYAALQRLGHLNGRMPFESFRKQARVTVTDGGEAASPTEPVADSD